MYKKKDSIKRNSGDLELLLLRVANNNFELDLIKGLLDENKIPYIVKERGGIGGHMKIITGQTLYGADVLVEKSFLEMAKEILDGFILED